MPARFALLALATAAFTGGCTTAPDRRPAADSGTRASHVSYRTELPEAEGRHQLQPGQSVQGQVAPLPDNPLPAYPQALVARGLPPLEFTALVTVDEAGRVSAVDVLPTPAAVDAPCAVDCTPAFDASLRQTLAGWRFHPLQIAEWTDGPDIDGDGEADSAQRTVVETRPYSLRLRFRFEVRDGRATVTTRTP